MQSRVRRSESDAENVHGVELRSYSHDQNVITPKADDVWVVVGLLQDGDFARSECDEVLKQPLHSDSAALK